MKSQFEMLKKAVEIADNDPNTLIGVFCDFREIWKEWVGDGEYLFSTRIYTSKSGGLVQLNSTRDKDFDIFCFSGCQYSHVFYDEELSADVKSYIRSRIRYAKEPSPEPSGAYNNLGQVFRTEMY